MRHTKLMLAFLAIVALTVVGGVLAWLAADTVQPLAYVGVFIFVIAGFLVSLCLHEFAHAYTAYRFGDHDAEARGYLTLNPLKYTHPLLSLEPLRIRRGRSRWIAGLRRIVMLTMIPPRCCSFADQRTRPGGSQVAGP